MKFEKVSKEAFIKDSRKNHLTDNDDTIAEIAYEKIKLPVRKTKGSAGYDFMTPYSFTLQPNGRRVIPTGIKAKMDKGEVLLLAVRSSVGIKDGVVFSNVLGIIDSDYYSNPDTDGDIMLALWNTSNNYVSYSEGKRIAQGLFFKFGITEDDDASGERIGGIGSTGA